MQIRAYHESDLAALRALHSAQGFDYAFPDLRNPLFLTKLVLTRDAEDVNLAPPFSAAGFSSVQSQTEDAGRKSDAYDKLTRNTGANGAGNCDAERASACSPPPPAEQRPATSSPILGAAFLRLTAEAYLLLDPHAGTPQQRWQWLLALHAAAERDAWQRGLEDVHAWLPPPIAQRFGKRITQLGWRRDDSWTPYCKRLSPL